MARRHSIQMIGLCGLVLFVSACASLNPEKMGARPQAIETSARGPFEVSPIRVDDSVRRLSVNGQLRDIDLNAFSNALADVVSQSLRESGVAVADGGRHIEVQVIWLDFLFQGPCLVDYKVDLGDAGVFGKQAEGKSTNIKKACDLAFEQAAK